MPRPPTPPADFARAHAMRAGGQSLRTIARELGVSTPTIMRWLKRPAPPAIAPDVAARAAALVAGVPEAPAEPDDPHPPEEDTLAYTRWQRRQLIKAAERSERENQHPAAARYRGEAVKLAPTIARLEKARAEDGSAIHLTREDVAATDRALTERVAAILERPLLCAACARALNVEIATGKTPGR